MSRRGWPRYLLVAGMAVALLLLGAAGGMALGPPGGTDSPGADSVDVGFAQDMTVHHEQAVQMASWERDHAADPRVRQLAFDIETSQARQIGHMQGWLALWSAPALPTGRYMRWMAGPTSEHSSMAGMTGMTAAGVDQMPGMASSEDLRRLRAATGRDLDVLFLRLMLRHHQGGSAMLDYAARNASVADVRNLAGQMLTSQTTESTYMRSVLTELGGAPLPG